MFCLCLWVYFVVISQVDYSKHWRHQNRIGSRLHYNLHFYIRESFLDWASFWIFSFGERNLLELFLSQQWSVFYYSGLEFQESSFYSKILLKSYSAQTKGREEGRPGPATPDSKYTPLKSWHLNGDKNSMKSTFGLFGILSWSKEACLWKSCTNQSNSPTNSGTAMVYELDDIDVDGWNSPFWSSFYWIIFYLYRKHFKAGFWLAKSEWFFTRSEYNNSLMRWVININQF